MAGFQEIDALTAQGLQADGRVKLIDVRTDAEVAKGKIGGALHIPLQQLPGKIAELDSEFPWVVYCQSGGRSAQACAFLSGKGFEHLYSLQGGIMAWQRSGLALEDEPK